MRVRQGAAAALLIVLSSCGSSAPGAKQAPSTSFPSFAARDRATRVADARTLSAKVERSLITLSGLEGRLGGAAAADTAYAALVRATAAGTSAWTAPPKPSRFADYVASDAPLGDAVSVMFQGIVGLYLYPELLVTASNGLEPGRSASQDNALGTVTGTLDKVTVDGSKETTSGLLTAKVRMHMDLAPCPGKDGSFTAKATMSSSIATVDGLNGINVSYDSTVTGQVNDDAELAGWDAQGTTTAGTVTNSRTSSASFRVSETVVSGKNTAASVAIGSLATFVAPDELITNTADLAKLFEGLLSRAVVEAAEKGWKSGRCVSLEPTTAPAKRRGLTPSSTVIITAQPKSKVDGWPVGGTVKATLSGGAAVDPADTKVPATARFTYTAPDQSGKTGTVSLEARSKRGIARAEVSFDTNVAAYEASGGLDAFHGTGTICDLSAPFTIQGTGITQHFTPRNATSGTYRYDGAMAGIAMKGHGTYTVKADANGGTITATGPGQVATPLGVFKSTGTETYTLTPTDKCP